MRWAALWVVVVAGCGRFGFGHSGDDDVVGDGPRGDGLIGDIPGDDAAQVCPNGLDICDGFEGASIDTSVWMPDAMVTLDTTRAHRGVKSIHVHMPAFSAGTNNYQTLNETKTIMMGATTFYVRAWLWLSALPAGQNGMELISAERPGSGGDYVFVFSDSTHVYTQFGLDQSVAMQTVPTASWFCVLFKVVRSTTTTGSLDLSGVGVPTLTLPNVQTDGTQPMTIITMGIGFSGTNVPVAQPALDMWIDDVIVHSSPVTCAD